MGCHLGTVPRWRPNMESCGAPDPQGVAITVVCGNLTNYKCVVIYATKAQYKLRSLRAPFLYRVPTSKYGYNTCNISVSYSISVDIMLLEVWGPMAVAHFEISHFAPWDISVHILSFSVLLVWACFSRFGPLSFNERKSCSSMQ